MLQSRRGFLIGAGAVLTTAFVKDARSFIRRTSQPLLASPSQTVETMYWHEIPDKGYQLTLGPSSFAPPPPAWRECFVSEGIPHRSDKEVGKICCSHCIEPGGFDKPVQARATQCPGRLGLLRGGGDPGGEHRDLLQFVRRRPPRCRCPDCLAMLARN
jgi:hypothetical protein